MYWDSIQQCWWQSKEGFIRACKVFLLSLFNPFLLPWFRRKSGGPLACFNAKCQRRKAGFCVCSWSKYRMMAAYRKQNFCLPLPFHEILNLCTFLIMSRKHRARRPIGRCELAQICYTVTYSLNKVASISCRQMTNQVLLLRPTWIFVAHDSSTWT